MINKSKTQNIAIPQSLAEADTTREKIAQFLKQNKIDQEAISCIELSVYEVLVNIIDHSPSEYRNRVINIDCSVTDSKVTVTISNYGDKFDITKAKLPDIVSHYKSGKKRGLGIYFIRTLMNRVKFQYKDHNNILKLTKNI